MVHSLYVRLEFFPALDLFHGLRALLCLLTRIFFRPIEKIINERETKVAADNQRLQGLTAQVETHTRALETQMEQARKEAQRIREEWSRKGEDVRARALSEAKEKAARIMEEKMNALEKEVTAAEKTLEKEIAVFSEKIRTSVFMKKYEDFRPAAFADHAADRFRQAKKRPPPPTMWIGSACWAKCSIPPFCSAAWP